MRQVQTLKREGERYRQAIRQLEKELDTTKLKLVILDIYCQCSYMKFLLSHELIDAHTHPYSTMVNVHNTDD